MNSRVSRGSDTRPTPLRDLRVVEISDRIAGSYCGKLLVDAGAQVRKIEPRQGDWLRRYSATCAPVPDGTPSPLFSYLNAGKQSLAIAEGAEDLAQYRAMLAGADVIIVTAGRERAAALGVDPQRLLADSPRAIVVSISDFGWTGPYAGRAASEFTLQAWAGSPGFRGDPAGPPAGLFPGPGGGGGGRGGFGGGGGGAPGRAGGGGGLPGGPPGRARPAPPRGGGPPGPGGGGGARRGAPM
ncbi:CoA transferase, partial [Mycobacterium sp. 852002-51057_SCH5723018]|uniref:CoA transferase n=1 Tax=Mycobacterium sp. 852002-51057_SCH5723018 TaxID=1834094 RepID=UPI0018D4D0BF